MATTKQIPFLMGRLIEHQECFGKLSTKDAQWAAQHPQEAIGLFVRAVENREQDKQEDPQPLLTRVGTIKVQPMKNLKANEFFMVNMNEDAHVKISYVGGNVKAWFFGGAQERPDVDETAPGAGPYRTPGENGDANKDVLHYYSLNKRSVDGPIIKELDGKVKTETTLAHIAGLMSKQGNGRQGALLTNGYANIFYVRDINGVLRALSVRWGGCGWCVYACSVEDPSVWNAGDRVFSRDS